MDQNENKEQNRLVDDLSVINLKLRNNTDATILMSLMGNDSNTQDISNQRTSYSWDVTGTNFTIYTTVIVTFRTSGSTNPFTTLTTTMTLPSLQGVVEALNSFGIASFFSLISGGNTYVQTYNDQIEFTQLEITASGGGSTFINYDLFQYSFDPVPTIINDASIIPQPANYINVSSPYNVSGTLTVPSGDTFEFQGQLSPASSTTALAQVLNVTTSTVLYSITLNPGDPFFFSWAVAPGVTYACNFTEA